MNAEASNVFLWFRPKEEGRPYLPLVPHKKAKGIPVPRVQKPAPSEGASNKFQKMMEEPPARVSSSMTTAELLADPSKGKIFLSYFGELKKKIQGAVYQKAGRHVYTRGSVCLAFVLNAKGHLEKVAVLPKGTHADEAMKELAVQCLRESAPFGSFPKDLGLDRISFNITIFFDGSPD